MIVGLPVVVGSEVEAFDNDVALCDEIIRLQLSFFVAATFAMIAVRGFAGRRGNFVR